MAEWEGGKLTVWTGSQRPFGVREELMRAFHLSEQNVRVIVPDTGAAYGGKHTGDAAVEAAPGPRGEAARAPGVDARGGIHLGVFSAGGSNQDSQRSARGRHAHGLGIHNYNSGGAAIGTPYEVPNQKSEARGFGIAGGFEKGGYIATCAEVAVNRAAGSVKIIRMVTAFDCGAVVNPDQLRNRVEGANVMAIGGALFGAIEFEDGRILNNRFSRYCVPRFSDLPKIQVGRPRLRWSGLRLR